MSSFMWSTQEMNASRSSLGKSGSRTRWTITPWRSSSRVEAPAAAGEDVDLGALRDELLGQLAHVARQPALHDRRVLPGEDQDARRHGRRRGAYRCRFHACPDPPRLRPRPRRRRRDPPRRRPRRRSTCAPSPPSPATARSTSPRPTRAASPRWPASTCRSRRAPPGPRAGELVTAPDIHGETGLDGHDLTEEAPLDERDGARADGRHAGGRRRAHHARPDRAADQRRGAARAAPRAARRRSARS